jgi:uncharacterized membrane protein
VTKRSALAVLAALWAVGALALTVYTLANTNDDARLIVIAAGLVGTGSALAAAGAAARGAIRAAGGLLIVSAITPSGFFYVPNVIALLAGVALLVARFFRTSRSEAKST